MNDYDDEDGRMQAEQHRDMCEIERGIVEALKAARSRPLTDDELMLLAWSAGVATDTYKEIHK